jgi:hypothetical protein
MRAREFLIEKKIASFRTGNLTIDLDDHAIEQTYFRKVNHRLVDRAIMKLKYIAEDLASLEPGEKAWAVDPNTGIALGIRRLTQPNHYLFATIVNQLTYDSDVPVFRMPVESSLTKEQISELSFLGSQCTRDCSGHRAGYQWYKNNQRAPISASPSFNKGAALAKAGK